MEYNNIGKPLLTFPVPAEEECLYSLLARYHQKSANRGSNYTSRDLFGGRINLRYTLALPYRIECVDSWISPGCGISTRTIRKSNTAQGYLEVSGIFPEGSFKKIAKARQSPGRGCIHTMLSEAHGNKQGLYFCPQCIKEDTLRAGEPYWHLSHQLLGVEYCPKHEELLQIYNVSPHEVSRKYFVIGNIRPEDIRLRKKGLLEEYRHQFIELGKTIAVMVNQSAIKGYKELMALYKKKNPKFDMAELSYLIDSYGGRGFISMLYPDEKYGNLMGKIIRKGPVAIPPVIHALIITVLELREEVQRGLCGQEIIKDN